MSDQVIRDTQQLAERYGVPLARSEAKELDHVAPFYRRFIERSPFLVLSTVGPEGTDCSPRGDPPGFVEVANEKTLLIPDRRGNNRIDSLRNIVRDPRVSLLFLIPGIGETLRVNGRAEIVIEPALLARFAVDGKEPRSVLRVTCDAVYYQCQKAIARSRLWMPESLAGRGEVPTAGQMLQAVMDEGFDGAQYDRDYPEHMKRTIY